MNTSRGRQQGPKPAGLAEYAKAAFMYRWNLLVVLGGTAAALLSPWPDGLLPLLGAAEIGYLYLMTSMPQFRHAIDAQKHRSGNFSDEEVTQGTQEDGTSKAVFQMVSGLPTTAQQRFLALRERCLSMRVIAAEVRGQTGGQGETLHTPALDRLLWVFLRLLLSEAALQRFLDATDERALEARLADVKEQLAQAQQREDERIVRSLTDSLAVAEMRLDNYKKAEDNARFVQIELDRIESKIQALTEMAINRQDPDFLSSQVDAAAESMKSTESTLVELQHITGMMNELEETPPILETGFGERRQPHVA